MDIRPIVATEADEYLRVLCRVFGLDLGRARQAFFNEPFFDLSRKWAAFVGRQIVGTLTTVPLQFADGPACGIAGVSTLEEYRGKGIAQAMLERVQSAGPERRALLFANRNNLYEKCGFKELDGVASQPLPTMSQLLAVTVETRFVQAVYSKWSSADSRRLIRDERRWQYWQWNLKSAYSMGEGYACLEFGRIRELLPTFSTVAFTDSAEWYGLVSLAKELKVPLPDPRREMSLMGWNFDYVPQMFLTDQF